jgi:ankyrin repeat protein
LAVGADVNAKNRYGSTPLHRAAYAGHKEIAELLIAKGADVNAGDKVTPLHYAAQGGEKEMVELLIVDGADVNKKDDDGKTPLDLIDPLNPNNRKNKTETADLLRKHGGKTSEELKAEGK